MCSSAFVDLGVLGIISSGNGAGSYGVDGRVMRNLGVLGVGVEKSGGSGGVGGGLGTESEMWFARAVLMRSAGGAGSKMVCGGVWIAARRDVSKARKSAGERGSGKISSSCSGVVSGSSRRGFMLDRTDI